MDEDEINSSDVEFEAPPANRFASAGKESIKAIIANATEDRLKSKKFSKQLQFTRGRPGTQYRNMLWYNRFEAFREHTLRVSTKVAPTGKQIERFLEVIVSRVTPKVLAIPSYDWLRSGFQHLLLGLTFHHEKFALSKHDSLRLSTAMEQLLKDGMLTREPSREHNWVGVHILRKITTAMLNEALTQGTLHWDVTLSRITSLVLVSCVSARAGDLNADILDDQPLPYLCYKDVVIKFVGGLEIEDLEAVLTIRNEKSMKDQPQNNRKAKLKCLADTRNNIMCPIKLILILALRTGNLDSAQTLEEALDIARCRKSKTFTWKYPDRPIICSVVARGTALLVEKAANRTQVTKTIAEGGIVAGILGSLTSHDLRYGSARDTANLSKPIKGLPTLAVAQTLGHSKQAFDKDVTGRYVGGMTSDVYSSRIEEDFQDPFGLQVADQPLASTSKKRRRSAVEVTRLCLEQNVDNNDKRARARVAYHDKQRERKHLVNTAMQRLDEVSEDERRRSQARSDDATLSEVENPEIDHQEEEAEDAGFEDVDEDSEVEDHTEASTDEDGSEEESSKNESVEDDDPESFLDTFEGFSSDDGGFDDKLDTVQGNGTVHEAGNLEAVLVGASGAVMTNNVEDAIFAQMIGSPGDKGDIVYSQFDFIKTFSTINVSNNQSLVRPERRTKEIMDRITGNSRNPLTFFVYHCKNSDRGCVYNIERASSLETHEKKCRF